MAKQNTTDPASFLEALSHPQKDVLLALRSIILETDGTLTEQIKWNAPSYGYKGDDRITFNLAGKGTIRIIFHRGTKKQVPPPGKLIADDSCLLDWPANDRAVVTFKSLDEVQQKQNWLGDVVRNWLAAAP